MGTFSPIRQLLRAAFSMSWPLVTLPFYRKNHARTPSASGPNFQRSEPARRGTNASEDAPTGRESRYLSAPEIPPPEQTQRSKPVLDKQFDKTRTRRIHGGE